MLIISLFISFSFLLSCVIVRLSTVILCIMTSVYNIASSLIVIVTNLFCIAIINHCVFPRCMLTVQEYDAEDDQGNINHMWSVVKVAPLESNLGFSLQQEDPELYSNSGKDDVDGWVCHRAWPHLQMPSRPGRPQTSQPSVKIPTLPQRVKQDLLEQHHHLCKLMSTLNIDPCKEYRYSCAPAVLSRIRPGYKTCTICNKVCSTTQNLCSHIRGQHMKDSRFKCNKCEFIAGDVHSLKVHALMHEKAAKKHWCDQCPKSYNTKGHLIQHKKEHMGTAGPCPHCHKTFAQQSGLVFHLKGCHILHGGPAPKRFKCSICSREYTWQAELCQHKHNKHGSSELVVF